MDTSRRLPEVTGNPFHALTKKQKKFVHNLVAGMAPKLAAQAAGYQTPHVDSAVNLRNPKVQAALVYMNQKHEAAAQMSRKRVMDGFLEAIEMAKMQGESGVMVNGWREIGRMCGYYAPERKVLDVNVTAKRTVDVIETMSDAELLEMVERDSQAIEGEFEEILADERPAWLEDASVDKADDDEDDENV